MTKNRALVILKKSSRLRRGGARIYPKDTSSIEDYPQIISLLNKIPGAKKLKVGEVVFCLETNYNRAPVCKTCRTPLIFKVEKSNKKRGWYIKEYCNARCFNNNPEIKKAASIREKELASTRLKKRKETTQRKYGSWEQRPGVNNFKIANARLQEDEQFREERTQKTKDTNLKKYGVEHVNQLPGEGKRRRKKANETCLTKYGVKNPGSLESTISKKLAANYKGKLENYLTLSKEFIEINFLDENRHIKRKELLQYLECSNKTVYTILERFRVHFIKKNSGGVGCFDPNKPTKMYYARDTLTGLYKIGITTLEIKSRFGVEFKNFVLLGEWDFDNGMEAFYTEQEILEEFREFRVENDRFISMGGKTEFFSQDVLGLEEEV